MPCPGCSREHARLARHQAAILLAQYDAAGARVLQAFAWQLDRMAEAEERKVDDEPTDPRIVGIMCPVCRTELIVP